MPDASAYTEYTLEVRFVCDGFTAVNHWNFWGYPKTFANGSGIQYYDPQNKLGLSDRYTSMTNIADGKVSGTPKLVITTTVTDSIKSYLNGGGKVLYLGSGSEFTSVVETVNWNAYAMPFMLSQDTPVLGGIGSDIYACEQFLELATTTSMTVNNVSGNMPLIGRIDLRGLSINSYLSELSVGSGTLVQSTLRFGDQQLRYQPNILYSNALWQDSYDNVIGKYLLDRLIRWQAE